MLVNIGGEWLDPEMAEVAFELDPEETGQGGGTHYRGSPGFVRFNTEDGQPVLIKARSVVALHSEGDGTTEVETARGQKVTVQGTPPWVAQVLNNVVRMGRVA